jgi:hypothetical protein
METYQAVLKWDGTGNRPFLSTDEVAAKTVPMLEVEKDQEASNFFHKPVTRDQEDVIGRLTH